MTSKNSKEVRGWLGIEPPEPRPQLDLTEEGYRHQPLSLAEQNVLNAKLTLLSAQQSDGTSLYEHLSTMLTTVLEKKPENVADNLESMSAYFKNSRMRTELSLKEIPDRGRNAGQARAEWNLFQTIARPMPNADPESRTFPDQKEEEFVCLPNLMRQAHLFNHAGFGLPAEVYVRVTVALRELARAWPFVTLSPRLPYPATTLHHTAPRYTSQPPPTIPRNHTPPHCTTLCPTAPAYHTPQPHSTTLHHAMPHSPLLPYPTTTLHHTAPRYTSQPPPTIPRNHTPPHCTTLCLTAPSYHTPQPHSTTLHHAIPHNPLLPYPATTLHHTAPRYAPQPPPTIPRNHTPPHCTTLYPTAPAYHTPQPHSTTLYLTAPSYHTPQPHSTTLHHAIPYSPLLPYPATTLHHTAPRYTPQPPPTIPRNHTPPHCTTLYPTAPAYHTPQPHSTTLHHAIPHSPLLPYPATTLHHTAPRYTSQPPPTIPHNHTPPHCTTLYPTAPSYHTPQPHSTTLLWGVIHGLRGDYTIAEGELREGDYETDISDEDDDDEDDTAINDDNNQEEGMFDVMSEDIKPVFKAPRKVPCEHAGIGLNRKVYFVCSQPGMPWVRLPHVTPAQITVARKIRKYFTGDLDHKMTTYPPFPGTERNYLRAQIARISAATHVSPIGVFKFDDEGEEEEETEGARDTVVVDLDFEGLSLKELSDPNLMSWVHHSSYILPQGRTSWFNPVQRSEGEEGNEEGEEEEREEPDEPEPESGPPLLAPLAEDTGPTPELPGWMARASTRLVPEHALASVQSLNWPGAVAVAADQGRFFENLYVGWGQKACGDNFEPALPDLPMDEFPTGPEVIETDDPSPETEAAIRAALREQEAAGEEEEDLEDGIIEDDDGGPDLSD
ncbi:uncharacterized protein LOC143284209 [Babylonia areolata]|uniref:uncharacterized protein LOC143284209 n=1 Tax=Babylonia areolata TaxID=304850 RepID=UPI003FD2BEF1